MKLIANDKVVKTTTKALITGLALSMLVTVTACNSTSSNPVEKSKKKVVSSKKSDMWIGETTVTVDGITVKINASRHKNPYPDRLPEIVATDPGLNKNAVMKWFAPLQTIEDTEAKPSIFYPEDSRWFLVDKKGNKKGKLSIDKFDGIYYMRIGPDKNPSLMFFRYGDAEPKAKDFIKNHGGVPDENLTLARQGFREGKPNDRSKIIWLLRGYGHQFKGIDIWDDTIEVGITKLSGAHYYRRWHEFKAEGDDKILLGPAQAQVIAEQVIRAYKKDWQAQPAKFNDILTGEKTLIITLAQLVYFDPRPRDSRHFYDAQVVYHPGWIASVSVIEKRPMNMRFNSAYDAKEDSSAATRTDLVDVLVDIGIPSLIIDAINGHVYNRKPKGDNLFK